MIRTTEEYKNNLKADGRYATDRGISSIYTYGVARLENNVYERANDVEGDPAVEYREIVREMYPLVRVDPAWPPLSGTTNFRAATNARSAHHQRL